MTQHVRKSYRMHRKATWAGVLFVAIVGALAATVLPATGAPGDNTGLPSDPLAVQPIENPSGGSTFACPSGLRQFDINNPKTGTYSTTVSGVPVSFTLTVASGGNTVRDKYLSFRASNASVHKVAVKGGTKTALYEYSSPSQRGRVRHPERSTHFRSTPTRGTAGSGCTGPSTRVGRRSARAIRRSASRCRPRVSPVAKRRP